MDEAGTLSPHLVPVAPHFYGVRRLSQVQGPPARTPRAFLSHGTSFGSSCARLEEAPETARHEDLREYYIEGWCTFAPVADSTGKDPRAADGNRNRVADASGYCAPRLARRIRLQAAGFRKAVGLGSQYPMVLDLDGNQVLLMPARELRSYI